MRNHFFQDHTQSSQATNGPHSKRIYGRQIQILANIYIYIYIANGCVEIKYLGQSNINI